MKFDASRFFIDRPIFAAVLSILIFVAGALSLLRLPVSEYPDVVPPAVQVKAVYPGADPRTLSQTVAAPLVHRIARADDDGFSSVFGTAFVAETPMVEEDTQPAPTFTRRQVLLG